MIINLIMKIHIFILALFFSSALACASPSFQQDERVLHITLDSHSYSVAIPELIEKAPPEKVTVFDIDFNEPRAYWAIPWSKLIAALGLEPEKIREAKQLSFVCLDGYTVNADTANFFDTTKRAWLALASADEQTADMPERINGRWRPLTHGDKSLGFDPFYLIWSDVEKTLAKRLPWPYQLAEIKILGADPYAALKPDSSNPQLQSGFTHFVEHCIRCHKIDGIGGDMGGDIIRDRAYIFHLGKETTIDLVKNITRYRPDTKMPDYSMELSDEAFSSLWEYLLYRKQNNDE